jgi:hypothetical protein
MTVARRGPPPNRDDVLSAQFPGNDRPPVKILTPHPPPVVTAAATPAPVASRSVWIVAGAIILAAMILTLGQLLLAKQRPASTSGAPRGEPSSAHRPDRP